MKRILSSLVVGIVGIGLLFGACNVFATDEAMPASTTRPQSGDSTIVQWIRLLWSLADLRETLAGKGTNQIQTTATATISGTVTTREEAPTVTIASVITDAAGTNYTTLSTNSCYEVSLINATGTTVSVRRNATGTALPLPSGNGYAFKGLTNANQLSIIRSDLATNQVTLYYEIFSRP